MAALEKHYSVREIAKLWGFSYGSVRKIFQDRADVIHFGHAETRSKRSYVTIKVPESVLQKVHAELRKRAA